jgi:hypothetical protein
MKKPFTFCLSFCLFTLFLGNSSAAQSGCTDPTACNFNPNAVVDNGSCIAPIYLIPTTLEIVSDDQPATRGGGGELLPALLLCYNDYFDLTSPYAFADQACVQAVIDEDPFCASTSWDGLCQSAYDECCPSPQWYIPNPLTNYEFGASDDVVIPLEQPGGGSLSENLPAVFGCTQPAGYVPVSGFCIDLLIFNDPFCVFINFDNLCYSEYFACELGCSNPVIAIPDPCAPPDIIVLEDDNTRGGGIGTQALIVCPEDVPSNYMVAESQLCAQATIFNDPFCQETAWDSICTSVYTECATGCTYPYGCNYDPVKVFDDGSCGYPGCIDSEALNYDPQASCDNGLCVFDLPESCPGDLNDDNIIGAADLLIFLTVFGTSCTL